MPAGTTTAMRMGSKTVAHLIGLAAERRGDEVAARRAVDGTWPDVTYAEIGDRAGEIARLLVDLGGCEMDADRFDAPYRDQE